MKEQIENGKDQLIIHLEQKIQQLRKQRSSLHNQQQEQVQYPKARQNLGSTDIDIYNQKIKTKIKLTELETLYEQKKQLQKLGIVQKDPIKIQQYIQDPFIQQRIQQTNNPSNLANSHSRLKASKARKATKPQDNQQKQKVLREEMQAIERLLKKKKSTRKEVQMLQELNYQNLLSAHQQKYSRYQYLMKKGNSRMKKQQLLEIAFNMLKQWEQKVKKQTLSGFLIANPAFARKFLITDKEVYRDLDVLETTQNGYLTFNQFYEFAKSIELTAPSLNPSKHRPLTVQRKTKKMNSESCENFMAEEGGNFTYVDQRNLEKYLKKLFVFLDKKKENVISRAFLVSNLKKNVLLKRVLPNKSRNDKGKKQLQKEQIFCLDSESSIKVSEKTLKSLAQELEKQGEKKSQKSYYRELESKYIGYEEMIEFVTQFSRQQRNKQQIDKNEKPDQQVKVQQSNESQLSKQNEVSPSDFQGRETDSKEEYEKQEQIPHYPWENQANYKYRDQEEDTNPLSELQQLDSYYKDLREKNANQIEWGGIHPNVDKVRIAASKQIMAEFKQLEGRIREFQRNQQV